METDKDILEHFGVKGMKWGVRRDKRPLSGYSVKVADKKPVKLHVGDRVMTPDAARAAELRKRSKAHGVSALNNDDIKFLSERIGLETKYMQLFPKKKSVVRKGADLAMEILFDVGKQQAKNFVNKAAADAIAGPMPTGKHMKRK